MENDLSSALKRDIYCLKSYISSLIANGTINSIKLSLCGDHAGRRILTIGLNPDKFPYESEAMKTAQRIEECTNDVSRSYVRALGQSSISTMADINGALSIEVKSSLHSMVGAFKTLKAEFRDTQKEQRGHEPGIA